MIISFIESDYVMKTENSNGSEQCKIFVGGISWDTTKESLYEYFSKFGNILDCVIMTDTSTGKSRGFGFVTFESPKSVQMVLDKSCHVLDNKIIDPKAAIPKEKKNSTSQKKFQTSLNKAQFKTRNSLPSMSEVFGNYSYKNEAENSRQQCRTVNISYDSSDFLSPNFKRDNKIFVGGIGHVSEAELKDYFSAFGIVTAINIMIDKFTKRPRGFAFVGFQDSYSADISSSMRYHIIREKQVEVKKAVPKDDLEEQSERENNNDNVFYYDPKTLNSFQNFQNKRERPSMAFSYKTNLEPQTSANEYPNQSYRMIRKSFDSFQQLSTSVPTFTSNHIFLNGMSLNQEFESYSQKNYAKMDNSLNNINSVGEDMTHSEYAVKEVFKTPSERNAVTPTNQKRYKPFYNGTPYGSNFILNDLKSGRHSMPFLIDKFNPMVDFLSKKESVQNDSKERHLSINLYEFDKNRIEEGSSVEISNVMRSCLMDKENNSEKELTESPYNITEDTKNSISELLSKIYKKRT